MSPQNIHNEPLLCLHLAFTQHPKSQMLSKIKTENSSEPLFYFFKIPSSKNLYEVNKLKKKSLFSYDESDYENGYSRNLLWRLWHASKALEMDYLHQKSTEVSRGTIQKYCQMVFLEERGVKIL